MTIRSFPLDAVVVHISPGVRLIMDLAIIFAQQNLIKRHLLWPTEFLARRASRWERFAALAILCILLSAGRLLAQSSPTISPSAPLDPPAYPSSSTGASDPAQTSLAATTTLPDEPKPQNETKSQDETKPKDETKPQKLASDDRAPQTKRILGIIPNFRSVSTDEKIPPQSAKEKFITTSQDSFDYSSAVIPALLAGYSMGTKATPEFHQGMAGYGRYFWHAAVDQTSENYLVGFVVPVITREDSRYYTLGRGGFIKRTGYALSRAVITRSDAGTSVFNYSEVVGAGASAGLSSLYYPSRERSLANTGTEWGLDVGIDAATFVFKEFWPDINHILFHGDKTPDRSSR